MSTGPSFAWTPTPQDYESALRLWRDGRLPRWWVVLPLVVVWANVHGGVLRNAGVSHAFPDLPFAPYPA